MKEEEEYWWEEDIDGSELEELKRRLACIYGGVGDNMASSLEELMGRRFCKRDLLGSETVPR
ncbi:hypothetical protein Patl1_15267 [Pistacia atlantica]|uniref:Uncharacterized protein n=1 Tax=Pistacia atlantica TaxID=434234 RepID=A0ACC1B6H5_9ROSI|nr:hypothetical protein Patl1_15267 [Pistacia atlantica]